MTVKNKIKQLEDKINKICKENSYYPLENIKIITKIQEIENNLEKLESNLKNSNENILLYLRAKRTEYSSLVSELRRKNEINKLPQLILCRLCRFEHKLDLINEILEDIEKGNL